MTEVTVADLPPVPGYLAHLRVLQNVLFCPLGGLYLPSPLFIQLVEETLPYLLAVVQAEPIVSENDVDAGYEGIVELSDSICREEENSLVVLDGSQKYYQIEWVREEARPDLFSRGLANTLGQPYLIQARFS